MGKAQRDTSIRRTCPHCELVKKDWIEQQGSGHDLCYRITEKGLAAKKMQLRIYT